jgi:hypothetical protein
MPLAGIQLIVHCIVKTPNVRTACVQWRTDCAHLGRALERVP